MSGLVELVLISSALLGGLSWTVTALLVPGGDQRAGCQRRRGVKARLWLYATLWVPLVVLLGTTLPGVVGALLGFDDHCLVQGAHHHHLCWVHPPHIAHDPLAWALVAAVGLPALVRVGQALRRLLVERRLAAALVRASRPSGLGHDVRLLDRQEPIALTVGTWRPVILLSTGLIAAVPERTLRVVLAHERAHVSRRDTLWAQVDRVVGALLPQAARRRLLSELALAREQACDATAAAAEGAVHVAAALTTIARLGLRQPAVGLSVSASSLEARVLHLLESPETRRWPYIAPLLWIVGVGLAGAGPVHNTLERVFALLLH